MSELGTEIRHYYEEVVERVDTDQFVTSRPRSSSWRRGSAVAMAAALVTLVALGFWALLARTSPDVAGPVPTEPLPAPTLGTEATPDAPSVIVLADDTELASITEEGLSSPLRGYETLVDYVIRELTTSSDYWPQGVDGAAALGLSTGGQTGLTVRLSVEPAVQEMVESVIDAWNDEPETFISVVVVDNETGGVLAAGPGSRPAGSGFDPERGLSAASLAQVYTAVAALEAGLPLGSTWDASSPQTFTSEDWPGEWTVHNAGSSQEPITLEQALYQAVDTVFAAIGVEIGPEAVIDAAHRLGANLTGAEEADPPPSIAIGAGTLDTFDAAAIFATLSNEGLQTRPLLIETITDPTGEVIYQAPRPAEMTIEPAVVADVRIPLAKVTTEGTAARAFLGFDQSLEPIGKTGTAQGFTNAWYVGSTDRYTVAVAMGRTDGGALLDVQFKGQLYARVFGGTIPAPIWREIVSQLHAGP